MPARPTLTDDEVRTLKRNEDGLNINQWAARLNVSYRTVQKVVFRETYKDVGELHECWLDLREKQKRGRKSGNANIRKPAPSNLEPHSDFIVQGYGLFLHKLADTLTRSGVETTADKLKSFLANHGRVGLRMGRTAKLNTREVMSIRTDMKTGMSYDEIAEKYNISRPLIAKVCGRGKYDGQSYVPSDYEAAVTSKVTDDDDYIEPDFDTSEVTDDT